MTMTSFQKDGPEQIVYQGKIFEVALQPMKAGDLPTGQAGKKVTFEVARRSPGVRLIIVKGDQMLVTKEFRTEVEDYDYRLPGGKVFDTLTEYAAHKDDDMVPFAMDAAKKECREETGLIAKNITHFATAHAGATVVWDLFYFVVDQFETSEQGQELEAGEVISVEWKSFNEIKQLCKTSAIKEDRTLGVLFKFFLNQG